MADVNPCNKDKSKNANKTHDLDEFTILINGQSDLDKQLDEFKKACTAHEKRSTKDGRKRYYNMGLLVKIEPNLTENEWKLLLKSGGRTFLFDRMTFRAKQIDSMLIAMQNAIQQEQDDNNGVPLVTGLAVQIAGDSCRIGRLRNNCSVFLQRGDITILTADVSYKFSCYKEIMYVVNLMYYTGVLRLGDKVCIGNEVCGKIVKKLKHSMTLLIDDAGIINSFEYINLPNYGELESDVLKEMFEDDLNYASQIKADFIVMPMIRCPLFLKLLYLNIQERKFKLIGNIDLQFANKKMLDLMNIMHFIDALWIPDLFTSSIIEQNYICHEVIPIARCLEKPIIGTVPIKCCSDFTLYKNHEYLWKIDCICIEKSQYCNKYPLIVKKLQPIKDYRSLYTDEVIAMKRARSSYKSVVNFIIRTITAVECQCIFLRSRCETSIKAFGRSEIYCPVYVLIPIKEMGVGNESDNQSQIELVKLLNLYRNLKPIIYTEEMNKCDYKPIDFGISFARQHDCIRTGDFVITVQVGLELEDAMEVGEGEDIVIMRAFYLPPLIRAVQ